MGNQYYTNESMIHNSNLVKEMLILKLIDDGIIDGKKFDGEKLAASYVVTTKQKGLFGKVFDSVFNLYTAEEDGKSDNNIYFSILRSVINVKEFSKKDVIKSESKTA